MARKPLKEKLTAITLSETEAIAEVRRKHSGLRAAEIIKANASELLDAGISDLTSHPDMKAALASRGVAPAPERRKGE